MRYFLHCAYNGKDYHGWQRQPGDVSIQEKIEDSLQLLLGGPTALVGAGRTDAGVNAAMMVAHFDTEKPIADATRFIASLNGMTDPFNICFYSVIPVHDTAHARFDAVSRTYRYYVHTRRSPFLFPYSFQCVNPVDFDLMNEAANFLTEVKDFTSFAKLHSDTKTNLCDVKAAEWKRLPSDDSRWYFEITANRFLRNMVRAVTGTLMDVGRGKLTLDGFKEVVERKDRCAAGTSMPPSPLFLQEIIYPYWKPDCSWR